MKMGTPKGYTIIEVMIFLAVSALMFVIAAAFIQGKESNAQFHQSIIDINTKIDQVIGDVSNGFYPSINNFSCVSSSVLHNLVISSGSNQQGTNGPTGTSGGCTFLGKVIQWGVDGNSASYNVYSLAGSQFPNGSSSGSPPTSYDQSEVTAIAPGPTVSGGIDATELNQLEYGLSFTGMFACAAACNGTNGTLFTGLGFLATNVNVNQSGQVGSQSVNTVPIISPNPNTANDNKSEYANFLDSYGSGATYNYDAETNNYDEVLICFDGPGSGQHAAISLYPNSANGGQRLTTNLTISNSLVTGCSS